jgi:hypothetical protein
MPNADAESLHTHRIASPTAVVEGEPKAPHYFDADTFREAQGAARVFLRGAAGCIRCSRALARIFDRLGSTFFHDDDPRKLLEAFGLEDRNACTLRVLAACIVLDGRDRVAATPRAYLFRRPRITLPATAPARRHP